MIEKVMNGFKGSGKFTHIYPMVRCRRRRYCRARQALVKTLNYTG